MGGVVVDPGLVEKAQEVVAPQRASRVVEHPDPLPGLLQPLGQCLRLAKRIGVEPLEIREDVRSRLRWVLDAGVAVGRPQQRPG